MICDLDCANCKFDDCINDKLTLDDFKRSDELDKEITITTTYRWIRSEERRELDRIYARQYNKEHEEQVKQVTKKWREENRARINAYKREWIRKRKLAVR